MISPRFWRVRSHLTRGARAFSALLFCALTLVFAISPLDIVQFDPEWLRWVIAALSLAGMLMQVLWASSPPSATKTKEFVDEETFLEAAAEAIGEETQRLEQKRRKLERILINYGEYMEFPDFKKLATIDWKEEIHRNFDKEIAALIDSESDQMLLRFSNGGAYWKEGAFDGRRLLLDLVSFVEKIATIYEPHSRRPLLELDLESLLKAINRASLQIILLLEELPIVDVKQINLSKVAQAIETVSKLKNRYEKIDPYVKPARYIWHFGKVLLTANPILGVIWIAASEITWKGGKELGKKVLDTYALSLLRQSIGIIAWETVAIYDPHRRYRSQDWVYGVEIAHLLSQFPATPEILRRALTELGNLPLRSSYDRVFLYRCIAQNASPKPNQLINVEHYSQETKEEIHIKVLNFFHYHMNQDPLSKATEKWKNEIKKRLGVDPLSY